MKAKLCSLVIVAVSFSFAPNARAAKPPQVGIVTTAALGVVLQNLTDQLNKVINNLKEAGQVIAIQAGQETYLAIEDARIAYEKELNTTFDKLNQTIATQIEQISNAISSLEKQTAADVDNALHLSQQVVNSFPFSKETPQLTSFSPKFIVGTEQSDLVQIQLDGNFVKALDPELRPFLQIGTNKIDPSENTTQSLKFSVPRKQLVATQSSGGVSFSALKVITPYKEGLIFKKRKLGTFQILIGQIPPSPGKITLVETTVSTVPDSQPINSGGFSQESSNDDLKNVFCGPVPPDGWKIDSGSVRFVVEWAQGNEGDQWSKVPVSTSNPHVCYEVTTVHHRFGTSGKVHWHYTYNIISQHQVSTSQPVSVDLRWGDSRSFPFALGKWRVIFDSFDGFHSEVTDVSSQPTYLRVSMDPTNTNVTITAQKASEIIGH